MLRSHRRKPERLYQVGAQQYRIVPLGLHCGWRLPVVEGW
jgi:hypothetical protein